MNNHNKFFKALFILKPNVEATVDRDINTEEDFDKIKWTTGEDNGTAITTTTNPHSELTWTKVKAEMDKLETEYDNQQYARNRKAEYPSIEELVVALYDTDDKAAIDSKRAEIKLKYPKPVA